jgi:hypothetical protein
MKNVSNAQAQRNDLIPTHASRTVVGHLGTLKGHPLQS